MVLRFSADRRRVRDGLRSGIGSNDRGRRCEIIAIKKNGRGRRGRRGEGARLNREWPGGDGQVRSTRSSYQGHARSIVVTLDDYSRLVAGKLLCFVVSVFSLTRCTHACFRGCTHCRPGAVNYGGDYTRTSVLNVIALDPVPVTRDSMVIASVVMFPPAF